MRIMRVVQNSGIHPAVKTPTLIIISKLESDHPQEERYSTQIHCIFGNIPCITGRMVASCCINLYVGNFHLRPNCRGKRATGGNPQSTKSDYIAGFSRSWGPRLPYSDVNVFSSSIIESWRSMLGDVAIHGNPTYSKPRTPTIYLSLMQDDQGSKVIRCG